MHIAEDIIKRTEAQFKMDCALEPSCEAGKRGYLIGRRPKMPDQTFMTDTAYGWLVRERMEKAAAGIDYGIASRARVYEGMDLFFRAILFCGKGYLMADEAIYDWCRQEYEEQGPEPEWFCRFSNLRRLDGCLRSHGREVADTHIYFLPAGQESAEKPDFEVRWLEEEELYDWKEGRQFRHAIAGSELMPDVLAVAAYIDGKAAAVAGASEDSPLLWQIGIDVLPEFSGKGLASRLVALLKQEILARGKIPFYGTAESHGISRSVAINAGFFPAWAEVYARRRKKD